MGFLGSPTDIRELKKKTDTDISADILYVLAIL